MNKAERESQFRVYFETCTSNPDNLEMVGIGNPYAKILIVGQESADMAIRRNIEDVSVCLNKGVFHHLYYQPRFYDNRIGKNGKRILLLADIQTNTQSLCGLTFIIVQMARGLLYIRGN